MSRRRELEQHRHRLNETREIMNSMKALAFMETRKLAGFLDAQRAVVAHIQTVAEDFFSFYPDTLPHTVGPKQVYLLLGSERGFCGDFNEALLKTLQTEQNNTPSNPAAIIAVGSKLSALLEKDPLETTRLDGTSVVEEVENTLMQIVDTLSDLQAQNGGISLTIIHHNPDQNDVLSLRVLPPFESCRGATPQFAHAPHLNLTAEKFCIKLIDRHLFGTLHETLYLSLMAENQRRVTHLEHAVQQLDDKSAALLRRSNTLRQEDITEEIEIILLSATRSGPSGYRGGYD